MENRQQNGLVRKRTYPDLVPPPPPPPKRIKRPKTVLDEDTYTEALSGIIARDFFPGLQQSHTQLEYLDALESKDPSWIRSAGERVREAMKPRAPGSRILTPAIHEPGQTPLGFVGYTPMSSASAPTASEMRRDGVDTNMSLAAFQANYTSEDNESFYQLLDKHNAKNREKHAWLWNGNQLPTKQQLKQKEVEERLSKTRALEDDGFKKDRLAIRDKDDRPAGVESKKSKSNNELMFHPEGIDSQFETVAERAQANSHAPPKAIMYSNTRIPGPVMVQHDDEAESTLAGVRDAIAGNSKGLNVAGGETPRVNGYAFVDDEDPQPEPEAKPAPPLITFGPAGAGPNPFNVSERRKRETLHHRMVDKIAESKRTSARLGLTGKVDKTPVPRFPSSPRVSGGLTPAAQRLWGRIDSAGRSASSSPFNNYTPVKHTPRATPRPRGSGLRNVVK